MEDTLTLSITVEISVKKMVVSAHSFKQLLFSLHCYFIVDMRANFWKAVNII
jgi:hypothetical protein